MGEASIGMNRLSLLSQSDPYSLPLHWKACLVCLNMHTSPIAHCPYHHDHLVETFKGGEAIINLDDADESIPNPFKFPKFPRALQDGLVQDGPVPTKVIRDAAKYTAYALYSYSRHISNNHYAHKSAYNAAEEHTMLTQNARWYTHATERAQRVPQGGYGETAWAGFTSKVRGISGEGYSVCMGYRGKCCSPKCHQTVGLQSGRRAILLTHS